MDYIVKDLGIDDGKLEGNMSKDKKINSLNDLSSEEVSIFKKYCLHDVEITKKLFDFIDKLFSGFKEFLDKKDINNFRYLTCAPGTLGYKALCNLSNLEEKYADKNNGEKATYKGGYVFCDAEYMKGSIIELDFSSAYPHSIIQGNLFRNNCDCCSEEEKWKGKKLFDLKNSYCSKKQGDIEKIIQKLYNTRKECKKTNVPKGNAIKILLNTIYGLMGNPVFEKFYDINRVSDITHIVQTMLKYAKNEFKKEGYIIGYGDTDSLYILDVYNDTEKLLKLRDKIMQKIKSVFPFPSPSFTLKIDAEIKYMQCFKVNNELLKKFYLYVTKDDKLVVKGLPVIKRNCSKVSQKIFFDILKPQIIKNLDCFFSEKYIKDLIYSLLNDDISLACVEHSIKSEKNYKSKTSIQYQILKRYGEGKALMIPVLKDAGIGKDKKYCSLKEFKEKRFTPYDVDISNFLSELNYFIKPSQKKLTNF